MSRYHVPKASFLEHKNRSSLERLDELNQLVKVLGNGKFRGIAYRFQGLLDIPVL